MSYARSAVITITSGELWKTEKSSNTSDENAKELLKIRGHLKFLPVLFASGSSVVTSVCAENDIAARVCSGCQHLLVDNDTKLKEAMSLKDAHIMKPDTMTFAKGYDKKGNERVEIRYYDYDGEFLSEMFYLNSPEEARAFYFNFTRMHNRTPEKNIIINNAGDVLTVQSLFRIPMFVIARKQKYYWEIREKIF